MKISILPPGRKGEVAAEELHTVAPPGSHRLGQAIPVRGCAHLPALAVLQQGRDLQLAWLTAALSGSWGQTDRQTDSNQLPSEQANETQPGAKRSTQLEM